MYLNDDGISTVNMDGAVTCVETVSLSGSLPCYKAKKRCTWTELAMPSVLAGTTKGLIVEFMCGSFDVLYSDICQVKAKSYHTLEKPIFWHPTWDWVVPCGKAFGRTMLIGVYKHILEYYHKPKLRRLKQTTVLHDHVMKNYEPLGSRSKGCRRLHHILEWVLKKQIELISSPPF